MEKEGEWKVLGLMEFVARVRICKNFKSTRQVFFFF